MSELKPCAFCGNAKSVRQSNGETSFWRVCALVTCGAEGPFAYTEADADAAWNRRAPGYREGAEAMREAAAREADCGCACRAAVLAATTSIARTYACGREPCGAVEAAVIRALPIPEAPK